MSKFIYRNMTPFKWFVLENFPFIENDFEAINNYRLFSKVVEYLNEMKDNVNNFGQLLEEFSNYFDNLDVQEEINNKLDEMVEDGTLQEIIADYLNTKAIFCYDNVSDMKQATNLINGSYAKTFGFYEKNDDGNGEYYISNDTNLIANDMNIIQLDNGLKAVLLLNNFNVRTLGAKGNGINDDTNIFKKCIELCENNNYKNLIIPNGTYKITDTLTLSSGFQRINIIGENRGLSILQFDNSYEIPLFKIEGSSGLLTGNYIKNLTINGTNDDNSNNKKSYGIHIQGVTGMDIENCKFNNFKYAVLLENNNNNFTEYVICKKCDFRNCFNCIRSLRTGTQMSFHGCGLENCTIGESNDTNSIIYIDKGCQFYNSKFDFIVWKSNNSPIIYLNGDTNYLVQTRQIFAYGNIRIEGQQTFNIFDGVNISNIYFEGNILGLAGNYNIGKAYLTNFQKISGSGSPNAFLLPYGIQINNLKNGDNINDYIKLSNSGLKIQGRITSSNYDGLVEFDLLRVSGANFYRVVKNHITGFNSAGLNNDNIQLQYSSNGIIFSYTGSDSETRTFNLIATVSQLDNRPMNIVSN